MNNDKASQKRSEPADVATKESAADISSLASLLQDLRVKQSQHSLVKMVVANVRTATEALNANKSRSFLTILGIFIGIAAVIAALILTQGASAAVFSQLSGLANSVLILPGVASTNGATINKVSTLTEQDVHTLTAIPGVSAISPVLSTQDQVVYGNQNWDTQIQGVSVDDFTILGEQMAEGSWFTASDNTQGTTVAILGAAVKHSLFDASGTDPLGQHIRIRDQIFRVAGVLAAQGGNSGQDDVVYIPFHTAQIRLKNVYVVDQIQIRVDATSDVPGVAQAVTNTLRKNHHLANNSSDDFNVQTYTQLLQRTQQLTTILTLLLVSIAAISLTVGGVGIMNIMLVSVTARTREIGIRISLGAKRQDIRNQFLIEALVLCLLGGIFGLIGGLLIGWAITIFEHFTLIITPIIIIVPFAVSAAIALIFGIQPAIHASHMDPISAIRSE